MPKKPNWDLKVQVEGKLLKLKNRTQKAIVEILREKLAEENNEEEQ
jgi:coiled-coil domain-containing protein 12